MLDYFKEEGIRSLTFSSSCGVTLQVVRSLAFIKHQESDFWILAKDSQKFIDQVKGKSLSVDLFDKLLADKVIKKCRR